MATRPLQMLVNAIMLSAIKKRARSIRIVGADPMRVFFDFGDTCIEEMRPPRKLRAPIMALLCEMSGATPYSPGHITLLIGDDQVPHHFDATLSGETFRLVPV